MEVYFILGLGLSGIAAARKLLSAGASVRAWDDKLATEPLTDEMQALVNEGLVVDQEGWMLCDEVVTSPGVPPSHPIYKAAVADSIPICNEVELALRYLPNPCVGVTGTNGKTTVTLLVEHLLRAAGVEARAVGNIGVPLCSLDCKPSEVLVVELSSYQIDTMRSPRLTAGVVLNVTPDHLERYGTMDAYAASKFRLGDLVLPRGDFWVEVDAARTFSNVLGKRRPRLYGDSPGLGLSVGSATIRNDRGIEYIFPLGYTPKSKHDRLNCAAALALCLPFIEDPELVLNGLATFSKPEHRLETVACIDGVTYINDSKGTNVAAVLHAIESLPGRLWLIAGGVDKRGSYEPWKAAFAGRVCGVALIGQAAERIRADIGDAVACVDCGSLEEAVVWARGQALEGDSVVLSPGCSSFDMFRSYAHRGDVFKRLVAELEGVCRK